MKTLTLTNKEHDQLKRFLQSMLSRDTWLGSKFLREEAYRTQLWHLMNVKHKMEFNDNG